MEILHSFYKIQAFGLGLRFAGTVFVAMGIPVLRVS